MASRLTDAERESGQVIVRSELWQRDDGFKWEFHHPPSGSTAEGFSPTVAAAYGEINKIMEEWFPELTPDSRHVLVLRPHFDEA